MEGAVGGRCPPFVWGDVVNDDLPFSGKRTPDWSKRSLSLRQAGQGTTSWTRSQILGRSLEYANCLFKHFTISIQRQTKPSHSSIRGEGEVFLHLRLRNKVTARNSNYQDLGHFKKNKNMPQYAPSTLASESQGHIAYCCSRVCNTITKVFKIYIHRRLLISKYLRLHLRQC